MNVAMIANNYKGCAYVRLKLPAYHNGFEIIETQEAASEKVKYADVVVFHRPEHKEHYELAKALKGMGKKIVMDNDDTFKLSYHPLAQFTPDAVEVELKNRREAIEKFIKISDLVTASTEVLANEYREHSDNVIVLPNYIDTFDWGTPLRNETDVIRIGLVGSTTMEYDYRHVKGVLRKLNKRKDVQLVMFGLGDKKHRKANPKVAKVFKDDYKFWDSLDMEQTPWCKMEDYQDTLNELRLDIMLIPRKDNYFNRCKSNIKFLEAAMCEIPVIAQSFDDGPYEEIEDYKTGIKIKDNKDWEKEIDLLIGNKQLRRSIGKSAHQYVLNNYNIENNAHLWEEAYEKLYENDSKI